MEIIINATVPVIGRGSGDRPNEDPPQDNGGIDVEEYGHEEEEEEEEFQDDPTVKGQEEMEIDGGNGAGQPEALTGAETTIRDPTYTGENAALRRDDVSGARRSKRG